MKSPYRFYVAAGCKQAWRDPKRIDLRQSRDVERTRLVHTGTIVRKKEMKEGRRPVRYTNNFSSVERRVRLYTKRSDGADIGNVTSLVFRSLNNEARTTHAALQHRSISFRGEAWYQKLSRIKPNLSDIQNCNRICFLISTTHLLCRTISIHPILRQSK